MSIKKKSKKKKNKNLIIFIFIMFAISTVLFILINIANKVSINSIKTHIIDLGEIKKTINKDAVIIRKSTPIVSKKSGILTKFYNQGDRVSNGAILGKVQSSDTKDNEIAKLEQINIQIEQLQSNNLYSSDVKISKTENDISYIYLDIQERLIKGDLKYLSKQKSDLQMFMNTMETLTSSDTSSVSIDSLYNQKNELEKKLSQNNTYIKSTVSGTLTYYFDDYEDLFSFDKINKISVKDIENANSSIHQIDKNSVSEGDIIGYVVDNHNYYIATSIDKMDIESIKRDTPLTINIDDSGFNSYFYDFFKDENGKFVGIFKVESDDFDFLKTRKENIDIIYSSARGISIPNKAITTSSGKEGVFVVDEIGIAKFYELDNVLLKDEENTIIKFSYDDFNDKSKINLYDEIILSPKGISDGQKVK